MTIAALIKILITGASGYIGGSILSALLASNNPALYNLKLSALTRSTLQAEVFASQGIEPYLFTDLDHSEELVEAAANHDIVIHNANGFHPESAKALIRGLAQRKKVTGRGDVMYIHTSGTSNLADQPISGKYVEEQGRVFSDTQDNVYEDMQKREATQE
jgi:NAD(P)-dependent dehydrogenase (short-subunit alcohol dehydrogenase family)